MLATLLVALVAIIHLAILVLEMFLWEAPPGAGPCHHYAIRAGRNLPDKEFRYLRTVIVTAAVYRGFDQELLLTDNPIN